MSSGKTTRILAISDLHMSENINTPESLFNFTDEDIYEYLVWALSKYDYVILNGDVFDLLETSKNEWTLNLGTKESLIQWIEQRTVERLQNTENVYPKTVGLIKSGGTATGRLIYVIGNHDIVVFTKGLIPNVVKKFVLSGTFPVCFEHGNTADIWNNGKNSCLTRITKCCYCCYNVAEDFLAETPLEDDLVKIVNTVTNTDLDVYTKYAEKVSDLRGYSCVVYGHTHKTDIQIMKNGCIYANTGRVGIDENHNDMINEIEIEKNDDRIIITQQCRYLKGKKLSVSKRVVKDKKGNIVVNMNLEIKF
jgi:UDP-2,3-diacylglucosamine pyrophosphatase LpxH